MSDHFNTPSNHAAWGGIILSIISISGQDVLKTIVLGGIGTTVSFLISALLGRLFKKKN
ncbi:MAG TPA: hypothetical protein VFW07_19320 [Parafilimonas sp.]|nr:hypothetical protein [Parafilimonas sp.]